MLQDMVRDHLVAEQQQLQHDWQPQQQLPLEEISSPISTHVFNFSEHDLFPEGLQNSDVTSSSNCCYEENSSYATNLTYPQEDQIDTKFNTYKDHSGNGNTTATATTITSTTTAATNHTSNNLSVLFDSPEFDNDISASIDFSSSPSFSVPQYLQLDYYTFSSVQPQVPLPHNNSVVYQMDPVPSLIGAPLPSVFEEDCLSSVPSYVPLNPASPSFSFLGPSMAASYMPTATMNGGPLSADNSEFFSLMGTELQHQEIEYQGDNGGIFCQDSSGQRFFNPRDLQVLSNENQQLVGAAANSGSLGSEINNLPEDTTFKVGKLSAEQRKEKITRYMKKRNERNFSKKIKYACRKTLADSRPRVRGRFAKNDEFGGIPRAACIHHEEDDDDEHAVVKEEEDLVDSSDIFTHISGVNSFKCNYHIQSWT